MLPICRIERGHTVMLINHAVSCIISSYVVCMYVFVRSGLGRSGQLTKRSNLMATVTVYIHSLRPTDSKYGHRSTLSGPQVRGQLYCVYSFQHLNLSFLAKTKSLALPDVMNHMAD